MLEIWTSKMGSYNGPDAKDISVKSGAKAFAPTWEIVMGLKNGKITEEQYLAAYLQMMRESWNKWPGAWSELLQRETVTLKCFCRGGTFCHRYILVALLLKAAQAKGIEAKWKGDRNDNNANLLPVITKLRKMGLQLPLPETISLDTDKVKEWLDTLKDPKEMEMVELVLDLNPGIARRLVKAFDDYKRRVK